MLGQICNRYGIDVNGIVHLGASYCQELEEYRSLLRSYGNDVNNILWIEAIDDVVAKVKAGDSNIDIRKAVLSDADDQEVIFKIASNDGISSSILDFNIHKKTHPNIDYVKTVIEKTITFGRFVKDNNIDIKRYNALVLDLQGVELRALKGMESLLDGIDIICTEINIDDTYKNCDKFRDLNEFLLKNNFTLAHKYIFPKHSYGDAVYVKQKYVTDISVILTVYNKADIIRDIVLNLYKYSSNKVKEYIFVIDGCFDNSEEIIRSITPPCGVKTTYVTTENVFETRANNAGLRVCTTPYAIIIQDDMLIMEQDWDRRLLKPLTSFNDVWAVTARTSCRLDMNGNFVDLIEGPVGHNYGNPTNVSRDKFYIGQLVNRGPLMVRMDIMRLMNYFDETLPAVQNCDDADLCFKIFRKWRLRTGAYWIGYTSPLNWGASRTGPNKDFLSCMSDNVWECIRRHKDIICNWSYNEVRDLTDLKYPIDINTTYSPTIPNILCTYMSKYGSDKGSPGSAKHNYTRLYYELFKNMMDKKIRLFELGLGTNNVNLPSNMGADGKPGASLYAWRDMFKNGRIFGADIDKDILFTSDRIKTYYCDQTNSEVIAKMWNEGELEENFDIIIEDGLHEFDANVSFFENSIHKLKIGGVYITEDINTDCIEKFRRKIGEWKDRYKTLSFRLENLPLNVNNVDNILLIAQKNKVNTRTIVTGADYTHYKTLTQFLDNLSSKNPGDINVVVYDLGLAEEQLSTLKNRFNKFIYKTFDYSKYPSYFNIRVAAGEYAWKPVIIYDTAMEYGGKILWCDSGTLFNSVDFVFSILKTTPLYSTTSSGNIAKWTHPSTLKYMGIGDNYLGYDCRNAALLGFDLNIDWVSEFVRKFRDLAMTKDCIAPEGSSRANHRQDQAVFTLLYYKYKERFPFNHIEGYVNYTIQNDVDNK